MEYHDFGMLGIVVMVIVLGLMAFVNLLTPNIDLTPWMYVAGMSMLIVFIVALFIKRCKR